MGLPAGAVDLPDPLESAENAPAGDGEDLLSQLAGDAVNRMMGDENAGAGAFATPKPLLNPVQELTSQLDTFFEELRQRQAEAAAVVDSIPEANPIAINDQERAALDAPELDDSAAPEPAPPRDLIAQYESKKPTPLLLRPFDRGGAVVERLSPFARFLVSATALLSFLAAAAALVYVLILRQG